MAVQHTKILSWKLTRLKKWLVKTKERTLTQFCSSMRPTPLRHWAWSRRSWWTAESMEDLLDRVWRDCSLLLLVILTEGDCASHVLYNKVFELVWPRIYQVQFVWRHEYQIKRDSFPVEPELLGSTTWYSSPVSTEESLLNALLSSDFLVLLTLFQMRRNSNADVLTRVLPGNFKKYYKPVRNLSWW